MAKLSLFLVIVLFTVVRKVYGYLWAHGHGECFDDTRDLDTLLRQCELPLESPTVEYIGTDPPSVMTPSETVRKYAPNNNNYPCYEVINGYWETLEDPIAEQPEPTWRDCMSYLRNYSGNYVATYNGTHCIVHPDELVSLCKAGSGFSVALRPEFDIHACTSCRLDHTARDIVCREQPDGTSALTIRYTVLVQPQPSDVCPPLLELVEPYTLCETGISVPDDDTLVCNCSPDFPGTGTTTINPGDITTVDATTHDGEGSDTSTTTTTTTTTTDHRDGDATTSSSSDGSSVAGMVALVAAGGALLVAFGASGIAYALGGAAGAAAGGEDDEVWEASEEDESAGTFMSSGDLSFSDSAVDESHYVDVDPDNSFWRSTTKDLRVDI